MLRDFVAAQFLMMREEVVHRASGGLFFAGPAVLAALLAWPILGWRDRGQKREETEKRKSDGVDSGRSVTFMAAVAAALLALVFSTRAQGLLYGVPLLSSFRWPFKYFLFFAFFGVIAAVGLAERWSSRSSSTTVRWISGLLAAGVVLNVVLNVAVIFHPTWNVPFGPYRIDRSLADLTAEIEQTMPLDDGRVVSFWQAHQEERLDRHLALAYATVVGGHHLGGYDPIIAKKNLDLALGLEYSNIYRYPMTPELMEHLCRWSVRYIVTPNRANYADILDSWPQLDRNFTDEALVVFRNSAAWPLVSLLDGSSESTPDSAPGDPGDRLDFEWRANGMVIDTQGRSGTVRVGVSPLPWWTWRADGLDMGSPEVDESDQLLLALPEAGAEEVVLEYRNVPFRLGVGLQWAFLLSLAAIAWLRSRREGALAA